VSAESRDVAHQPISVEKHDETILAVQQVIDLPMNQSFVVAKHVAKRHGRNSAAGSFGGRPVRSFKRSGVAAGSPRPPRAAALTSSEPAGGAGTGLAYSAATMARDRKNARSSARPPKVATASAHRVRASTWGQSSSHA
jgi:hypothetical protein